MQLISKYNKLIRLLLCVNNVFSEYALVVPLKDKKGIIITKALQNILDESNRKPNKIWVNKGSDFYNRSMKSYLQENDIKIYSTHYKGKLFGAERFVRTLKNKTYK